LEAAGKFVQVTLGITTLAMLVLTSAYLAWALFRSDDKSNVLFPSSAGRRARSITIAFFSIVLIGSIAMLVVSVQKQKRRPSLFLIPEGYVGWVRIEMANNTAPPLPIENGYYVVQLPESGLLKTSTPIESGWASDDYFYYSTRGRSVLRATAWGGGGMIWAGRTGREESDGVGTYYQEFFVGTEEEYREKAKEEMVIGPRRKKLPSRKP
jgi:hypothetical protein